MGSWKDLLAWENSHISSPLAVREVLACSMFSDSRDDPKVKGMRKYELLIFVGELPLQQSVTKSSK